MSNHYHLGKHEHTKKNFDVACVVHVPTLNVSIRHEYWHMEAFWEISSNEIKLEQLKGTCNKKKKKKSWC